VIEERSHPGVEKVHDLHHYLLEKREAFEKLAELVSESSIRQPITWSRLPAEKSMSKKLGPCTDCGAPIGERHRGLAASCFRSKAA
jgi:hypothetical protein